MVLIGVFKIRISKIYVYGTLKNILYASNEAILAIFWLNTGVNIDVTWGVYILPILQKKHFGNVKPIK